MSTPIDSAGPEPGPAALVASPAPAPAPGSGRLLIFAVVAGLLAGLLAWGVGERTLTLFVPRTTQVEMRGIAVSRIGYYEHAESDYKNAIFAYSVLGASLGVGLGVAAGLARRSPARAIKAGAIGLLLGVAIAAATAALVLPVYFHEEESNSVQLSQDLLLPLLVHAGCWAAAGLAGGLAWGLGLGISGHEEQTRLSRAAIGGLLGAVGGAIAYELIAGFWFPSDRSGEPLSRSTATRLIARVAVALLAAVSAAAMAQSAPRRAIAHPEPIVPPATPGLA